MLFIVCITLYQFNNSDEKLELTSAQISDLLINEAYDELDEDMIYEAYCSIAETEVTSYTGESQEYIDYLIENDIEINSIIEEL